MKTIKINNESPLYIGSPVMIKKDKMLVPNYTSNYYEAAVFCNDNELNVAIKILPLLSSAYTIVKSDIEAVNFTAFGIASDLEDSIRLNTKGISVTNRLGTVSIDNKTFDFTYTDFFGQKVSGMIQKMNIQALSQKIYILAANMLHISKHLGNTITNY